MPNIVDPDSPTGDNTVIEHIIDGEENAEGTRLVTAGIVESTISYDSVSGESTPSSLSEEFLFPTDILGDPEPLAASDSINTSSLQTTVIQFRPRGKLDKKSVTQPKKPKKKDSQGAGKPNPPEPVISLPNPASLPSPSDLPNIPDPPSLLGLPNPPELPNLPDPQPREPTSTDLKREEGR
ncbi:uncharacterized protein FOMMEDRAFT_160872 [Fomitiporia mediterranea MF3/22]|uniref:uncharacterized protein n=1 Tax=Fomitiporia mediterranea (strain MF3/22) TaxID=694068 RepID=UPI0004409125|nr:uncharacterized protein FOMMEDRAFT_160872 [Fomitiporia mediterranea MF3/22]EJC99270.1 hypothetical protein FOMMEDRAFT_160872 [Fomitiporia mediterranea MF3/22]